MKSIRIMFLFLMLSSIAMAQNTTKITGKKNEALKDSLQTTDYRYVLPIFGDEVRKKGYDMPLPAGMMLGVYTMEQDLLIDDLAVGFGNTELVDISDLVVFSQIRSNATVYTFRPDVWVFPFMNVYGIFNKFSSNTNVEMVEPFPLKIPETSNDGYGAGFGTTLAYGYGPVWFSGNFNFAWSKTPVLTKPTQSFSTSLRIGTAKGFNNDKHRLSVWVGTNYLDYVGSNGGSYDMTQLIPDDSTLLEDLYENVNDMLDGLNDRYEDFCAMPGNRPKCAVLDPILEEFKGRIEDKIGGVEFPEELNINYSFTSSPLDNWNMVAGAQYQFSKRWETRVEWGFLGSRRSFLFNVNYRFGLKRKV